MNRPDDFLAIGEVLSLLQEEFPEVTIGSIRAIEADGLVRSRRTPAGHRRYDWQLVETLRWILRRLADDAVTLAELRDELHRHGLPSEQGGPGSARSDAGESEGRPDALPFEANESGPDSGPMEASTPDDLVDPADSAGVDEERPVAEEGASARSYSSPVGALQELNLSLVEPERPAASRPADSTGRELLRRDELCELSGISDEEAEGLEVFGILVPENVGGVPHYPDEAVEIAQVAARLFGHGLEPRHLRIFRMSVDKEQALFEQLITPLLRQNNPVAGQEAASRLAELADLGGDLRALLLDEALRGVLGGLVRPPRG